jgi:hypothetical protein
MTAAWWRQLAWRRIAWLAGSVLLLLGAALYRQALEASMAWHMLLQMPAIFVAGVLVAQAATSGAQARANSFGATLLRRLRQADLHGLPGLLALSFLLSYWMIPKTLEHTLVSPLAEYGKFVSLFGGGLILRDCLSRANRMIQLFFVGNVAWMTAIVGLLYQDNSTRLCNFYLLDDQTLAGQGLVLLSVALPVLWLWQQAQDHADRRLPT